MSKHIDMAVKRVAIIGSGPAALMAADVLASAGVRVLIFEKEPRPGRKLYLAGSSGLNIGNSSSLADFSQELSGSVATWSEHFLEFFTPQWLAFLETELGLGTFLGTSNRYFLNEMHAARLIKVWRQRLVGLGVEWRCGFELVDFRVIEGTAKALFNNELEFESDVICFCLGGGSYVADPDGIRWPLLFADKGYVVAPLAPANVGFEVDWSPSFLTEADGRPLKNILLRTNQGVRRGDLVITAYGLEGTPIYHVGTPGWAYIDLKPDLSIEALVKRCQAPGERFSPLRALKRRSGLSAEALALIFHHGPKRALEELEALCTLVKNFPLELIQPRPIAEAISTSGGLHASNFDEKGFQFREFPQFFAAGEMLDWSAPTGGYLIQVCVSQGFSCAKRILEYLEG